MDSPYDSLQFEKNSKYIEIGGGKPKAFSSELESPGKRKAHQS
jgi:hypothetical protein